MIFKQLLQQLQSLRNLISSLSDEQYTTYISHLTNTSIGAHTRHIIELLKCAIDGYEVGEVDYINRKRNLSLETERMIAINTISEMEEEIIKSDKSLLMVTEKSDNVFETIVTTTYFREIIYNTEHTIHHLALIKVGLIELNMNIVNPQFGMAYSTIKYKTEQAS